MKNKSREYKITHGNTTKTVQHLSGTLEEVVETIKKFIELQYGENIEFGVGKTNNLATINYQTKGGSTVNYGTYAIDLVQKDEPEEPTLPITLGLIKAKCGWSAFCDTTDRNPYTFNEWTVEDNEIFNVKESHAKKLGFI